MRDQSKILEEIGVFFFFYDINDLGNDIKRKDGRHLSKVYHCGNTPNLVNNVLNNLTVDILGIITTMSYYAYIINACNRS